MIRFIMDYTTKAIPPEVFTKGQEVERSDASELYFVQNGIAGFVVDGKLVDQDHRPIVDPAEAAALVLDAAAQAVISGRGGELPLGTGAPGQSTSGPGNVAMFGGAAIAGGDQQSVALQAEIDRLLAEQTEGASRFADMNNSHVADKERLQAEIDRLAHALTAANGERNDAVQREAALAERVTSLEGDLSASRSETTAAHAEVDRLTGRVAELEKGEPEKPASRSRAKD